MDKEKRTKRCWHKETVWYALGEGLVPVCVGVHHCVVPAIRKSLLTPFVYVLPTYANPSNEMN